MSITKIGFLRGLWNQNQIQIISVSGKTLWRATTNDYGEFYSQTTPSDPWMVSAAHTDTGSNIAKSQSYAGRWISRNFALRKHDVQMVLFFGWKRVHVTNVRGDGGQTRSDETHRSDGRVRSDQWHPKLACNFKRCSGQNFFCFKTSMRYVI